jgi:glycosyltransferase involved in cell wall biosynthesis
MTTISVIMPVFNEGKVIKQVIASLLAQDLHGIDLSIYIVDGQSTDGSADVIKAISIENPKVHYLLNEKRKTPFAFNIGLKATTAEYVAILGAHTIYDSNYLKTCLEELIRTKSIGCSGYMKAQTEFPNDEAKVCYWMSTSPFGVSGQSFRTMEEGYADSIPYAVFKRDALLAVGGYNETLLRNQDNDMNQRLREAGHKLYLTKKTGFLYQGKNTTKGILSYAFTNGKWNAYSFRYFPKSMKAHHLIPFFFCLYILGLLPVAALTLTALFPIWIGLPYSLGLVLYMSISIAESIRISKREQSALGLQCVTLFPRFHFYYGFGTLNGFFTPKHKFQS